MRMERRLKASVDIDMTPLIDVVYQLVIFFMITTVFKTAPGIKLDLPSSSTATTVAVSELSIVAISEEEIYVNKLRTNAAGAMQVVSDELEGKDIADIQAVLEAESQAPYQLVIALLDALRRNGVENVGLITRAPAKAGP